MELKEEVHPITPEEQQEVWAAAIYNNKPVLERIYKTNPNLFEIRAFGGVCPIHMLMLYNQKESVELLKQMVLDNKQKALIVYEDFNYRGMSLLHLAIGHNNLGMVSLFVQKAPELLKSRAVGDFFSPLKRHFYVQVPLFLAACWRRIECFHLLLKEGADLFDQDDQGNTILHIMVKMHDHEMYQYLVKLTKDLADSKLAEKLVKHPKLYQDRPALWKIQNHAGLTPLALAATLPIAKEHNEKETMFSFILKVHQELQWTVGAMALNLIPLDELDTDPVLDVTSGRHVGRTSLLESLIQHNNADAIMEPIVQYLIDLKWTRYAKREFNIRSIGACIVLASLSMAVILRRPTSEGQSPYRNATTLDAFRIGAEVILCLGVAIKMFFEGLEMHMHGIRKYFRQSSAAFADNALSAMFFICFLLLIILRGCGSQAEDPFVALCVLLCGIHVFSFLVAVPAIGPYVVMILMMLRKDVSRFLVMFSFFLWTWSTATYALVDRADASDTSTLESTTFGTWWVRMQLLGLTTLGAVDFDGFNESIHPDFRPVSSLLYLSYIVVTSILIVNLLIAMMTTTMSHMEKGGNSEWRIAFAQTVITLESTMTRAQLKRTENQYWQTDAQNGRPQMLFQGSADRFFEDERQKTNHKIGVGAVLDPHLLYTEPQLLLDHNTSLESP